MADFIRIELQFADGSSTVTRINATEGAFIYRILPEETPPLVGVFVTGPGSWVESMGCDDEEGAFIYRRSATEG